MLFCSFVSIVLEVYWNYIGKSIAGSVELNECLVLFWIEENMTALTIVSCQTRRQDRVKLSRQS